LRLGGPTAPLFWRVFLVNGAMFGLGTAILAFSPATVSSPPLPTEGVVLVVGLVAILAINAVLLRLGLAPLDRLMRMMETIDLLRPGQRLPEEGSGEVTMLIRTFNEMLDRLERERAASSAQALSAQEGERQRVARELHDQIGQGLTAILLELERAAAQAPSRLRDDLLHTQETARAGLEDVRHMAQRLRPDVLEELGMLAALTELANEFASFSGLPVRRRFTRQMPTLSREIELVCYRVVQESLTNIARHADAGEVDIAVTCDEQILGVRVRDDGRGLVVAEGAGIRGMRERALLVGGQLQVSSTRGQGTSVDLRIPVPVDGDER
jgi:two-component system, NarL family, sensor histidine kinase UhpB